MYLVTAIRDIYDFECGIEVVGLFTTKEKADKAKEKVEQLLDEDEYDDSEVFIKRYDEENLDYVEWYECREKM